MARGLSLIELMIALLLGLLVVGGAIGIFVSNRRAYNATESLSRVQENARVAFEMISRDVREAGGSPCSKNLPTGNVLKDPTTRWWSRWGDGVHGYDSASASAVFKEDAVSNNVVAGTDALDVMTGSAFPGLTVVDNNPDATSNSANFKLNQKPSDAGFHDGDIVMVCDYRQASLLQITNVEDTSATVVHNAGGSQNPGNCSKGLGLPTVCSPNGNRYEYGTNSLLVKLLAARWYVGNNPNGGKSLYRATLQSQTGNATAKAEEVIDGVAGMQLEYLLPGANDYVDATAVATNWPNVIAVRITIQLESDRKDGTDNQTLKRNLEHIVSLRNRNA
ncbi:PilW family protein [Lysobacter cavernae]|uniref:PilW family protein n=1 Tax=Lysobacter cavernae TaxID=1685901 RepID=A0ABV7RL63_9GAMM